MPLLLLWQKSSGGTNTTLDVDSGSYTVTGTAATFDISLSVTAGSYTVSGTAATFDHSISVDAGSYVITGTDADVFKTRILDVDAGSYTVTGTATTFDHSLSVDSGSFVVTGTAATFDLSLSVSSGSYVVTGTDVTYIQVLSIVCDSGSFSVSGTATTFDISVSVSAGSYSVDGTDATFQINISISADAGSFTVTGTAADLTSIDIVEVANTVAPVVSGTLTRGSTLSCTTGTWTGTEPITYEYQWRREGENILQANSSTYVVIGADVGKDISCVVTARNWNSMGSQVSNTVTITGSRYDVGLKPHAFTQFTRHSRNDKSRRGKR
jgi:uncharacterized protein (UPF0303 family)